MPSKTIPNIGLCSLIMIHENLGVYAHWKRGIVKVINLKHMNKLNNQLEYS